MLKSQNRPGARIRRVIIGRPSNHKCSSSKEEDLDNKQPNNCTVLLFDYKLMTKDIEWYSAKLKELESGRGGRQHEQTAHEIIAGVLRKTEAMKKRLLNEGQSTLRKLKLKDLNHSLRNEIFGQGRRLLRYLRETHKGERETENPGKSVNIKNKKYLSLKALKTLRDMKVQHLKRKIEAKGAED
jgi:hypothetical protein